MKSFKIYSLFLVLGVIALTSCEKVITPDLSDIDRRLVIEAPLTESADQSIRLSQSGDFYANSIDNVSNATLTVTEVGGASFPFTFNATTERYEAAGFTPQVGSTYSFTSELDGVTYEAQAQMPAVVPIDTALVIIDGGGFFEGNFAYFTFTDPGSENNYYRAKVWTSVSGTPSTGDFNLFDDDAGFLIDGDETELVLFVDDDLEAGDEVFIVLQSIDEGSYDYLTNLSESLVNNNTSAAPFNPKGNITNDALGYFGCISADTVVVTIP